MKYTRAFFFGGPETDLSVINNDNLSPFPPSLAPLLPFLLGIPLLNNLFHIAFGIKVKIYTQYARLSSPAWYLTSCFFPASHPNPPPVPEHTGLLSPPTLAQATSLEGLCFPF